MIEKNPPRVWIKALFPPLIWGTLIFVFSSQPTLPSPNLLLADFLLKKSAHIFVYAVLYLLVWRALFLLTDRRSPLDKRVWLGALLICFFYALSDEWHQSWTPTRTATWRDVSFDSLGILGAFLWRYQYI